MTAKSKTIARISNDAVKKATGKVWKDWFKILDREESLKNPTGKLLNGFMIIFP